MTFTMFGVRSGIERHDSKQFNERSISTDTDELDADILRSHLIHSQLVLLPRPMCRQPTFGDRSTPIPQRELKMIEHMTE